MQLLRVALILVLPCQALRPVPVISRRTFGSSIAVAAPLALGTAPASAAEVKAGPTVDAAAPPRPELPSARLPSWTLLIPMIEIDDAVNAWADDARKGFGLSAKAGLEALNKGGQPRRVEIDIQRDAVAAMAPTTRTPRTLGYSRRKTSTWV